MALNDVVAAGQPFSVEAEDWNDILFAARKAKQGVGSGPSGSDGTYPTDIVKVRNDSGAALDRFAAVGLGAPLISPTDNLAVFKEGATFDVVLPEAGTHEGLFGVILEPLADGAIGVAVVSGVVPVKLTGADAGFAEIDDGETVLLASSAGSAKVLWAEAGSAERWALVRLGGGGTGTVIVSVSSTTVTDGTQPGHLEEYDTEADSWTQGAVIRVKQANGFVLATGKYLRATYEGIDANGAPVYLTANQTGKDGTQVICDNVGTKTMTLENGVIASIVG